MRRMVKENLLKFDGTPLFPERIAYTVPYKLSDAEAQLYKEVTDYVREEFNRAEALANDKRAGTVGFALTILQRRLASSPEAIYQSLRRRRERLEKRLRELELLQRGGAVRTPSPPRRPMLDAEDVEDLEEAPENEVEAAEEEILDQATAARTIAELQSRDRHPRRALKRWRSTSAAAARTQVARAGAACSARSSRLRPRAARVGEAHRPLRRRHRFRRPMPSPRQKLVVFTEHRDTLNYLEQPDRHAARPHGGRGHHPRRHGPRGAA